MNGLFQSLNTYLDTMFTDDIVQNLGLANKYGVALVGYEGGMGINPGGVNRTLEMQAQTDPRMYDVMRRVISIWNQHVSTPTNLTALNGGYWGLLYQVQDPGSPKWDGVMSALLPPGDADLDGVVNANDVAIVKANMGLTGAWWEQGDFDHDGIVDATDLAIAEGVSSGTATYNGKDATTQGMWKGTYGTGGYNIIGNRANYPSYASVNVSGASNWTWSNGTTDMRALQKAEYGATNRIAACWYGNQFTVDIKLTDGQTHLVSLYALDWDSTARSERIDVVDPATGAVLDSRTIASFHNGEYLSWKLTGHIQLRFTRLSGANAIVSGLFFSGNTASYIATDATTQGTWRGTYGTGGYNIIGDRANYPSYASVNVSGASNWTWSTSTTDMRALQKAESGATDRIAAAWYSGTSLTVDINLTDGLMHKVSIYAVDWDHHNRKERIDVVDASTGTVLDTRTISSFDGGEYLSWNLSGHIRLVITDLTGGRNAVISGLFFG
jgi:hypothetical protein